MGDFDYQHKFTRESVEPHFENFANEIAIHAKNVLREAKLTSVRSVKFSSVQFFFFFFFFRNFFN